MYLKNQTNTSIETYSKQISELKALINKSEAILIGAGAGLSTSAGFSYSGERFNRYFNDFSEKFGFKDMYSGGFYPFESFEEYWAYWSRFIFYNRYEQSLNPIYQDLLNLIKGKNYFVLTTNVDHQFQSNGFDKERLFYTQGDYGLFQCSVPCHDKTYDNEVVIRNMVFQQFGLKIPSDLIPKCPICNAPMTMNLRSDDKFIEDIGWHLAESKYIKFIEKYRDRRMVLIEIGVGFNTPSIIKYPFWRLTANNRYTQYVNINLEQSSLPYDIQAKSMIIKKDIGFVLRDLNTCLKGEL